MKTWYDGEYIELYVGQVVTVYRRGQDHILFVPMLVPRRACRRASCSAGS